MLSSNATGWRAVAGILAALTVGAWGGGPTVTPAAEATASVGSVRSLAAGAWGGHRLGWGSGWTRQVTRHGRAVRPCLPGAGTGSNERQFLSTGHPPRDVPGCRLRI